ncbi:hypothetical protein [Nocardia sp. CA-119907]
MALLVLPHLALAPHVQGLAEGDADHAVVTARRLIAALLHPYRVTTTGTP